MRRVLIALALFVTLPFAASATECIPTCAAGLTCVQGQCALVCDIPCKGNGPCTKCPTRPGGSSQVRLGTYTNPTHHVSIGMGSTIGELYGAMLNVELNFGGDHALALQLDGGGGVNGNGSTVGIATTTIGYRGTFLPGPVRLTVLTGIYGGYLAESDWYDDYGYSVAGLKTMFGFVRPLSRSVSWGLEAGFQVGYRSQLSGSGEYSGLTGGFESRLRILF